MKVLTSVRAGLRPAPTGRKYSKLRKGRTADSYLLK